MRIIDFLKDLSTKYPKRSALIFDGGRLTYSQLYKKVVNFASGLAHKGIKQGDKAAILMYNSPEFVISFLALISCGAVVVPVNPLLLPEELEFVLRHSDAKLLISSKDFDEHIQSVSSNVFDVSLIIASGYKDVYYKNMVLFDDIYKESSAFISPETNKKPCAIIYSSGDSGYFKGTVLTSEGFLLNAKSWAKALDIKKSDKMITYFPMHHPFAITSGLFMMFLKGACSILVKNNLPFKKVVKTAFLKRATVFASIPHLFNLLSIIKTSKLFSIFNPIRMCISFGDFLPEKTLSAFSGRYKIPIIQGYGLIEAGGMVSVAPADKDDLESYCAGYPIDGVSVSILSPAAKELPSGEIGEIALKGANIMDGYYKDEYSTKKSFKNGWFLTDDMGKRDEKGLLYVYGRKSDIIKSGKDIYFIKEVVNSVYSHPGVEEAYAVPLPSGKNDIIPFVFAVIKQGENVRPEDILKHVNKSDDIKMEVRHIEILNELPRNANGKIDRRKMLKIAREKDGFSS